jgi:uncharacterized repeat protein (TIGR03803 family)
VIRNRFLSSWTLAVSLLVVLTAARPYAHGQARYKVLHGFGNGKDGGGVYAGVVIDSKGNLYGKTSGGGAYGYGTVFQLAPVSGGKWAETILHSFCRDSHCTDGAASFGGVILDAAGNLYGGSNTAAFEMMPGADGWKFGVIYNGASEVDLVLDNSGRLYGPLGAGKYGEGAISELSPGSEGWTETLLYSFCSQRDCRDGEPPEWGLSWDTAGNLYGTTEFGGNYPPACPGSAGCGVAYQLQALGGGKWQYHELHRFAAFPKDGQLPYNATLTADGKGNVYGTTLYSGTSSGTVFELSPQPDGRWKETILYDFPNSVQNGGAPTGGVTFDNLGNLYGTASAGGDPICSCGVVFKMTPQANGKWSYTVLHRFKGIDGNGPGYNLIFDKNYKHLYGTTVAGGSGHYGVVYEITP